MALFAREYKGPPRSLLPPEARAVGDARAARITLRLFAAAVFVLVVGAVFAYTVTQERDDTDAPAATGTAPPNTAPVPSDTDVGPPSGADIGAYLEDRRQALAAATGERVAVISFDAYASESDARAKVGPVPVDALLAAAPGAHPSLVTTGLEAWAKSQRQADELEREEIRKLLPTVDDPVFRPFYESEIVRLDAAIASVSPTSAVVYGLVVRAPAETLKALAATEGVRLVDVGAVATAKPEGARRGLRPEETTKSGQPATRPV